MLPPLALLGSSLAITSPLAGFVITLTLLFVVMDVTTSARSLNDLSTLEQMLRLFTRTEFGIGSRHRVHCVLECFICDDLVAVLCEFLDDDTMLAQSCTDWLYLQHWYTVVPDPAMRVTLWAPMGLGKGCEVCHTTGPLTPFCVCSQCLLREVGQGIETLWVALCAFCVSYV